VSGSVRVSVAICTRDGARYVEEQVHSILAQTRLPDEIVLSDDDSRDGTVAIVRRVVEQHRGTVPELLVLANSPPLGVTRNFEQAMLACSGDLVALSDQDDVWHGNRIERQVAEFEAHPDLDLVFGDAVLVDEDGRALGHSLFEALGLRGVERSEFAGDNAFATLLRRNVVTGATVMVRRSAIVAAAPFPAAWVHDEWLALITAARGHLGMLDEPLIDYRQHGANQIGVTRPTLAYRISRVFEPRGSRYVDLVVRAQQLVSRLNVAPDLDEGRRTAARMKLRVEEFRLGLPSARPLRLLAVLRAGARGWYRDFCSQRNLDMLRDLLQPAKSRGRG